MIDNSSTERKLNLTIFVLISLKLKKKRKIYDGKGEECIATNTQITT